MSLREKISNLFSDITIVPSKRDGRFISPPAFRSSKPLEGNTYLTPEQVEKDDRRWAQAGKEAATFIPSSHDHS